jgi:branched-chain amino acid transport system permease protein
VLVQLLVSGARLGSMYGLVALGYHMTWATSRTMNFSQGHVVMVGAVAAYGVHVAAGWPLAPAALAAILCVARSGSSSSASPCGRSSAPARRCGCCPRSRSGIIVENVVMLAFGKDARALSPPLALKPVFVLGAGVYPQELLLPGRRAAADGRTQESSNHRTTYGRRLQAVAWDSEAAGLMGIHVPRAVAVSYARVVGPRRRGRPAAGAAAQRLADDGHADRPQGVCRGRSSAG